MQAQPHLHQVCFRHASAAVDAEAKLSQANIHKTVRHMSAAVEELGMSRLVGLSQAQR